MTGKIIPFPGCEELIVNYKPKLGKIYYGYIFLMGLKYTGFEAQRYGIVC